MKATTQTVIPLNDDSSLCVIGKILCVMWEKRGRVFGEQVLCVFFGQFGRQGTKLLLRKKSLSIQRLKNSFVYFLWSEMKLFIKDGPSTLVDFIGWEGTC